MAIDYGTKRTGLAVTDPMKIIATPLFTVETKNAISYIMDYIRKEKVEKLVIGMPKNLQNRETDSTKKVVEFAKKLNSQTGLKVVPVDERFTSKIAFETMIAGGLKKKDRQIKSTIDKLSATIILQSYLEANPSG